MTKVEFVIRDGAGLDTEESMKTFFEEKLKSRFLELLEVIAGQRPNVIEVKTKRWGPGDPSPKVIVMFDENIDPHTLGFIERRLRIENPNRLKEG